MAKLILWGSTATTSTIVHMVLREAEAAFEARYIGLRAGDNRQPGFLAINPKGEVPALQVDDIVITETPAICQFVAETHQDAGLLPASQPDRARCLAWLAWASYRQAAAYIPALLPIRATREAAAHEAVRDCALHRVRKAVAHLDSHLADGRDYIMGDKATLPDFYVTMQLRWASRLGVGLHGHVAPFLDRMLARPAVARALAEEGIS